MYSHHHRPYNPNNPNNEPTGHYTGRCGRCGSNNLWDDNLHYGCNNCKAFFSGDRNPPPIMVRSPYGADR